MKKLEFRRSDFVVAVGTLNPLVCASMANEIFNKWWNENVESASMLYGLQLSGGRILWSDKKELEDTHTARLICIEEIKIKECDHRKIYFSEGTPTCKDCNKTLRPKNGWEAI